MTPPKKTQITVPSFSIFRKDAIKFLKSLNAESVDLIATDPAYSGMNQHLNLGRGRIVGTYADKGKGGKWFTEFHDTPENYEAFLAECKRVLKPNRHIFIMFDSFSMLTLGPLVRKVFALKNILVWDKVNIGMGHYFRRQSEFILFASKGKRPLTSRRLPDIWHMKRIHRAQYPTQKPVELFEAMISSSKSSDDKDFLVCDPFMGAGSCAVAALKQSASFVGADISSKAFNLCEKRVRTFIAKKIDVLQRKSAVAASETRQLHLVNG